MAWHVVSLDRVAPTPWRNGGGLTRELVVFPVHEHWHWRISVAEVTQDGPFSRYEGVQRWFAVLSGGRVQLKVDGAGYELDSGSAPFAFNGEAETACQLLDGATRDINLMVRQGRGRMERVRGDGDRAVSSGSAVALWSGERGATATFEGEPAEFPPNTLAWRHLDMGGRVELRASDALWMEVAA
jgi:environmental stress-induced protein Ves